MNPTELLPQPELLLDLIGQRLATKYSIHKVDVTQLAVPFQILDQLVILLTFRLLAAIFQQILR